MCDVVVVGNSSDNSGSSGSSINAAHIAGGTSETIIVIIAIVGIVIEASRRGYFIDLLKCCHRLTNPGNVTVEFDL